jgi:hypothetical protein
MIAFLTGFDRAGIPRTQQPTRQWTVGDDPTQKGRANAEPHDLSIRDHINGRWVARSPLRRAAHAALACLESHRVDLHAVHLHGEDIDTSTTPHFVGFELRHLRSALHCFQNYHGVQWLEVVHPHTKGSTPSIADTPSNRDKLSKIAWNPGSFFN